MSGLAVVYCAAAAGYLAGAVLAFCSHRRAMADPESTWLNRVLPGALFVIFATGAGAFVGMAVYVGTRP